MILSQNNLPKNPEPFRIFSNKKPVCNTTHHTKNSTLAEREREREKAVPQEIIGVV
jgi:hypothetical protein